MRDTLTAMLRRDYRVLRAATGEAALQIMEKEDVDLMLLDVRLPGISGFEVLKIVKENYPYIEVIVISAMKELDAAIEAMRHGAYHYISKDFELDGVRTLVANASERQDLSRIGDAAERRGRRAERPRVRRRPEPGDARGRRAGAEGGAAAGHGADPGRERHRQGAAGAADPPRARARRMRRSSPSTSPRSRRSWSRARCSATRRGRSPAPSGSSSASSSWPPAARCSSTRSATCRYELQAKLLRAIQEGEIERVGGTHPIKTDFRLIAATNVDLEKAVKDGRFREDLFYRLNVIPIRMPALRDRIEDLPELARFFLRRYNVKFRKNIQGIADSTLQILANYWWPGNIRELENLIERLVAVSDKDWITDEDLPYEFHVAQLDHEDRLEREPARARGLDLRAQLHHPRAREGQLERDGDGAHARHPAQHAEVQDGPARDPRARAQDPRQLTAANQFGTSHRQDPDSTGQHVGRALSVAFACGSTKNLPDEAWTGQGVGRPARECRTAKCLPYPRFSSQFLQSRR